MMAQKLLPEQDREAPPRVPPKYFWHFPKVPPQTRSLGVTDVSAIEGCHLRQSWRLIAVIVSFQKATVQGTVLPLGVSPNLRASGGQQVLSFLQRWMNKAHVLPGVSPCIQGVVLGSPSLGWPPRLVGEGTCGPLHTGHLVTEHSPCVCTDANGYRCVSSEEGVIGEVLTSPAENSQAHK